MKSLNKFQVELKRTVFSILENNGYKPIKETLYIDKDEPYIFITATNATYNSSLYQFYVNIKTGVATRQYLSEVTIFKVDNVSTMFF